MDSKLVLSLCVSLVWFFMRISYVCGQKNIFNVTDYGAIPDEKTDNSKAFLSAWKQACGADGGEISVPLGIFYVSGANFEGPCNGHTFFQINGNITASSCRQNKDYWISFTEVDGLTIFGPGTFEGNGPSAWSRSNPNDSGERPTSIKLVKVNNAVINDIRSLNSKMFHYHVVECENVTVTNVYIASPSNSPNTDGIHLGRCHNVSITNSSISTGDDCISVGDGNTDITIESTLCGPGHGFSIGSLGKEKNALDVKGVTVRNCTLLNTDNGLRIKTVAPSLVATIVSNVIFQDIIMDNVKNPIFIDQYYCPDSSSCSHERDSDEKINGVKYINIRGSSASPVALNLQCSKTQPCDNLEFNGVNLIKHGGEPTSGVCSNAHFKFLGTDNVPSSCSSDNKAHWYSFLD